MKYVLILISVSAGSALENGLARLPPLGWRSWNAYGGSVTQAKMEAVMRAMVDTSRGFSLKSLGYVFIGLDDGYQACGAGVNGSFHDERGELLIDKRKFPDMGRMVELAHSHGLKAGWYLNNCLCNEHQFDSVMADTVLHKDVAALRRYGFDGLKLDACSQWNNLTRWSEVITASGSEPILIENCHQGGYTPGSRQWQSYFKHSGGYTHKLGYLYAGHDAARPLVNVTLAACEAACDADDACAAICFESDGPSPSGPIEKCYRKEASAGFAAYDISNGRCSFDHSAGDCPYNFYRTSGDINARSNPQLHPQLHPLHICTCLSSLCTCHSAICSTQSALPSIKQVGIYVGQPRHNSQVPRRKHLPARSVCLSRYAW